MRQWLEARGRSIQPLQRGLQKPPGDDGPADAEDSDGALSSDDGPADAEDSDGALGSDVEDDQQKEEIKTEIDNAEAAREWYENWRDAAARREYEEML